MIILAVDPGSEKSAWARYDTETKTVLDFGILPNDELKRKISNLTDLPDKLAMEMIASYGMAVGKTVFETCVWIGRLIEAWTTRTKKPWEYIYRKDEKITLCGSMKAKDPNISAAIANRYGGDVKTAKGTKKNPGPLYGVSKDVWAAIAVAITCDEMERE